MIARYGDTDYGYSEAGYGYGVSAFTGFDGLSIIPDTLGWWSVSRRVLSRYNGPLFRARRSTDSAERDWFGTGPQGEVNIADFQSWCSGGDAFAVTLYDQSGLARNFAQATTTIQPILAESGTAITENGRLAAKFVAANARRMAIPSSTAMFNALHTTGGTVLVVCKNNDTAADQTIISNKSSDIAAGIRVFANSSDESFASRFGRQDVAGVATDGYTISGSFVSSGSNAQRIAAMIFNPDAVLAADRAFCWVNGTQRLTNNAQTATPFIEASQGNITLGASSAGATPTDGPISELALFSALISTTDRTAWQSRSGVFYTVTIS